RLDSTLLVLRGEMAMVEGHFDAAIEAFSQAVQMHADSATPGLDAIYPQILHALALSRTGRHDEAWESWHRANAWLSTATAPTGRASAALAPARAAPLADAGDPAATPIAFAQADADLARTRTQPISVHWQLRENRDEVRFRLWQAQALHSAGQI